VVFCGRLIDSVSTNVILRKKSADGKGRTSIGKERFMETQLAGKTIVVTGASGGIGGEVIRDFIKEGANVVAHFFQNSDNAHQLAPAMVYLASSHLSGHVSGQMLTVSGGMEGRVLYGAEEIDPAGA
jgi:CheY-specific phosphatase CheX